MKISYKLLEARLVAAAVVTGLALSACAGGAGTSGTTGTSVFPAQPAAIAFARGRKSPCAAAQVGYVFPGRCAAAQVRAKGGRAMIPKYEGYLVKGIFGANDAAARKPTVFVVRDATGTDVVSGTVNGVAWPPLSGVGTAFLYLAVTNTSATATVTFVKTPAIVIANVKHTGFPGTTCGLYVLTGTGWEPTGVTATPSGKGKGRSRVVFPATALTVPVAFLQGPTYFGFACQ